MSTPAKVLSFPLRTSILCIAVAGLHLTAAASPQPVDASAPATGGASESERFPPLPKITLMSPSNFPDEKTYRHSVPARADALAQQAATVADPVKQAERWLASVNLTLAFELEPLCTRTFLGLPSVVAEGSTDVPPQDVAGRLKQASERLAKAWDALHRAEASGGAEDAPTQADHDERRARRAFLALQADNLDAFLGAMNVYLSSPAGAEKEEAWFERARQAASALAPLLEDENRDIASAAQFWQAVLRSFDPDPEAVLSRLDYISSAARRFTEPYGFFSRLLRCRVLADRQPRALAAALLLQLEERCFDWFEDAAQREAALRTVALLRLHNLRAWYETLEPQREEERAWCVAQAEKIIADSFGDSDATVLRLMPAVPVVVSVPEVEPEPNAENPVSTP